MKTCLLTFAVWLLLIGVTAVAMVQDQMPKQPKFLVVKGIQQDANYVKPDAVLKQEKIDDYDYKTIDAVQERAANCLQKIKQLLDGLTPEQAGRQSVEKRVRIEAAAFR